MHFFIQREKLEEAQKEWRQTIEEAYFRNVKVLRAHQHFRSYRNVNIFPYLKILDPQDYVEIIMQVSITFFFLEI